jgi:hypothetical protein
MSDPTQEQIAELAQQMHQEKSALEKSRHQQNIVPWNELCETHRVSLLREAEAALKN